MSTAGVELESWVNRTTVEQAHGRAQEAFARGRQSFAECGWRAAKARDPKLLKALERGAEIIGQMAEEQQGRTRRSTSNAGQAVEHTEAQLWREAYRACDEGRPIRPFEWIYGAAALLAGFQI